MNKELEEKLKTENVLVSTAYNIQMLSNYIEKALSQPTTKRPSEEKLHMILKEAVALEITLNNLLIKLELNETY